MRHSTPTIHRVGPGLPGRRPSWLALLYLCAIATGCISSHEELLEYSCSDSNCESSTDECQPNDRLGCDPSSNVRWYDSCSEPGSIFKTCDDNASCSAVDDTYDCICHPNWYGDGENCLPCTCDSSDPCCSNGCTLDAEHTSCTDANPRTITESCTASGDCVGTDYCEIHPCTEVVHTGQTDCFTSTSVIGGSCADIDNCPSAYDEQSDYCGQDGHHEPHHRPTQFTVIALEGDTDSDTDSDTDTRADAVIQDPRTDLSWSFEVVLPYGQRHSASSASTLCNSLTWGGLAWRLPTIREWLDVLNFNNDALTAPDEFAVEAWPSEAVLYPSASVHMAGVGHWHVQVSAHQAPAILGTFDYGFVLGGFGPSYDDYERVRCVSGEHRTIEYQSERFTLVVEGVNTAVLDRATGLEWTKYRWPGATWPEALAYCEALDHGGWQDWKLPDINELSSLLDFSQAQPASLFPFDSGDDLTKRYWSSTSSSARPDHAWIVRFSGAVIETKGKETQHEVRCVRR